MKKLALCALMFLSSLLVVPSWGATVTYTLSINHSGPGTWSVFADASQGDNGGISLWGVRIDNVNEIAVIDAPFIQYFQGSVKTVGLNFLENNDFDPLNQGMSTDGIARVSIGSTQELPSMPAVFGFGQNNTNSPLTVPGGATYLTSRNSPTQTVPYNAHLLLAHGTYSGISPAFAALGNSANVFVSDGNAANPVAATIQLSTVPEPSMGVVSLSSMLLLAASRSRRSK